MIMSDAILKNLATSFGEICIGSVIIATSIQQTSSLICFGDLVFEGPDFDSLQMIKPEQNTKSSMVVSSVESTELSFTKFPDLSGSEEDFIFFSDRCIFMAGQDDDALSSFHLPNRNTISSVPSQANLSPLQPRNLGAELDRVGTNNVRIQTLMETVCNLIPHNSPALAILRNTENIARENQQLINAHAALIPLPNGVARSQKEQSQDHRSRHERSVSSFPTQD